MFQAILAQLKILEVLAVVKLIEIFWRILNTVRIPFKLRLLVVKNYFKLYKIKKHAQQFSEVLVIHVIFLSASLQCNRIRLKLYFPNGKPEES